MTVLLVEDDADDRRAFQRSLRKAEISCVVDVAEDGQEAMDYLRSRESDPTPDLVFLDLKLPFVSGFEILEWIRHESGRNDIPVVILSGSDEARDHEKATSLGILDYLVKPATPEQLIQVFQMAQSEG